MAKVQRNGPCPCGSGNKAKRCCHGPHKFVDIRVLPLDLCQDVINDLVGTNETEMRSLFDRLLYLPELDSSLQLRLPGILTPDIDRAITALRTGDDEGFDRALEQVVPTLDTLDNRITLAAPSSRSGTEAAFRPSSLPSRSWSSTAQNRCCSCPP